MKATAQMGGLTMMPEVKVTKEWVEKDRRYWLDEAAAAMIPHGFLLRAALCDAWLNSQALSESVRSEARQAALEEAAKECEICASRQIAKHDQKVRDQTRRDLAAAIRALSPARAEGIDRDELARALLQKFNKLGYMETASRIVDFVLDRSAE